MRHILLVSIASFILVACAEAASDQVFSPQDVERLNNEDDLSKKSLDGQVELAPGPVLPFHLELTSKGNGVLELGGLGIRFYDAHHDLITFAGGSLKHLLIDIDGDGYRDLVFFGDVEQWDEKGAHHDDRPLVSIFHFDPKKRRLVNTVPDPALYVYAIDDLK